LENKKLFYIKNILYLVYTVKSVIDKPVF